MKVNFEFTWSDAERSLYLPLYRCNPLTVDDFEDGVSTLYERGLTGKLMFDESEGIISNPLILMTFQTNHTLCLDISDETTYLIEENFDQFPKKH